MVTAVHDGRRRVVAAVDPVAARAGLRPGMAMAHAMAMLPQLHVLEAEPDADTAALRRLALWCHRYTPLTAFCPDGLWLDISGSAHLFGGESALLTHLLARLSRDGVQARAAVADTPGAAHALARHGAESMMVAAPGEHPAAIAALPVASLRLTTVLNATLRRLGFERIGHLTRVPRASLTRRFGPLVGLRLDQAHGLLHESLVPLAPEQVLHRRETFLEPLLTPEALSIAITRLVGPLCEDLEHAGLGARRLDLIFERIDNQVVALRIGTAQPSRDANHLGRLFEERLDTVEPGMGVEAMRLIVALAEPLQWEQQTSNAGSQHMARLVDRLSGRLGSEHLYRAEPVQNPVPESVVGQAAPLGPKTRPAVLSPMRHTATAVERSAAEHSAAVVPSDSSLCLVASADSPMAEAKRHVDKPDLRLVQNPEIGALALNPAPQDEAPVVLPWRARRSQGSGPMSDHAINDPLGPLAWPTRLKVPPRLLTPPRLVTAIAALPNGAPRVFTWRRKHNVSRSEGPERVHEVWWFNNRENEAVRDYFQVEVEGGQRFWLFRQGDGIDLRTGNLDWFLHGLF